ncbi:hypothetical protein EYZ11_004480 [Aspergillus tanneri]|uniref:Uncharacterized protein n=1 Tax=Aspergillus tanneri TaxID=1220188 RepID=A0A4S3JKF7_9EURO|nr:uncharacterized protein ATNIH1004_008242 [Aspergillus tanneri]KAA8644045.1 hypothetical protein ATNIH1004_008242 [Aspergillus tanneri]THC96059.1 hypothetical protein EYZ11_004480 [Aspergillus tanneri]
MNGMNGSNIDCNNFCESAEAVNRLSFSSDGDRIKALAAAYRLVNRLETPWDTVARLCMTEAGYRPALGACLKIARDLQLFEKWHRLGEGAVCSDEKLADLVGCDVFLLQRILRHLAATNVLDNPAEGQYRQTAFSEALLQPVFGEWITYLYDATIPCFHKAPEYLASTGYQNPTDPKNGIFQYTKGFMGNLFEYYDAHPEEGRSFNNVMGGVMANQAGMLDIYPYGNLIDPTRDDATTPVLVDVGGNVGHDINKLLSLYPQLAPRLVLQDRNDVVRRARCPSNVTVMAHDFFTPQPVKGARSYYLHGVIHDWADKEARQILCHLRDAMTKGYSKLLVHDHILPERSAHPQATAYDLTMMVKVSAFERTESMWKELLRSVGFNTITIWNSPLATQSVIEVELS